MTLRRFSASVWQGGSRAMRYGSRSSAVNSPGCAMCASSARTDVGPSWTDDSNPRLAMTVNSSLVAFGQAEPPLEIEIVPDLFELSLAHEKAGQEADHQRGHMLANRRIQAARTPAHEPGPMGELRTPPPELPGKQNNPGRSPARLIVSCMAGIASQSQRVEKKTRKS